MAMLSHKLPKPKEDAFTAFTNSVAAGKLDTKALREMYPLARQKGWGLQFYGDHLNVELIYCDTCAEICFAEKTISAYHGAYWVCEDCSSNFAICKACGTYVLASDLLNPTHTHADFHKPGQLYFPDREHTVAAYNADVMIGSPQSKGYFKTMDELRTLHRSQEINIKAKEFRYFGVELEVEKIPGAPPDIIERVIRSLNSKFVMLKHDGSLSRRGKNGFEIVTLPGTLKYQLGGVWDDFFENLSEFFEEDPPTTGLHVHMSLSTILPVTIGKMLIFVNAAKNKEFVCDVARRQLDVANPNGRIYAGVHDDWKASDLVKLRQHTPTCPWHPRNKSSSNRYELTSQGKIKVDGWGNPIIKSIVGSPNNVRQACKCPPGVYNLPKYEALNVMTKRPTVELRIFRGIMRKGFLYAALEFSDALANYCADANMEQLNYESFLTWICDGRRKMYSNLFQHLVNLSWVDPPKQQPKELGVAAVPYQAT